MGTVAVFLIGQISGKPGKNKKGGEGK